MNYDVWVDPRVRDVRVEDVKSYLYARGWKPHPSVYPGLLVFAGPLSDDGEPILQTLPISESYRDYVLRVEQLIRNVSALEERYAVHVLDDILNQNKPGQKTPADRKNGTPKTKTVNGAKADGQKPRAKRRP